MRVLIGQMRKVFDDVSRCRAASRGTSSGSSRRSSHSTSKVGNEKGSTVAAVEPSHLCLLGFTQVSFYKSTLPSPHR